MDWSAALGGAGGVIGVGISWMTFRAATQRSREDRRIRYRDEERQWFKTQIDLALAEHADKFAQRLNGRYPLAVAVNPRFDAIEAVIRDTKDTVQTLLINLSSGKK